MLYPVNTPSRMTFDLNGIWQFALRAPGEPDDAPLRCPRPMPVPAAYNDIYPDAALRDHVGEVAYERAFTVSAAMLSGRLVLRFGGVAHRARVYVNGAPAAEHLGGFLPFEAEIGPLVHPGENVLRVIVDNTLTLETLPVGRLVETEYPGLGTVRENLPNFDFFNYAGILRPVVLYTTPKTHISRIRVNPHTDGRVEYQVEWAGAGDCLPETAVELRDAQGKPVASATGAAGVLRVENPTLWEPGAGYLYRLEVRCRLDREEDCYELPFGIRSVEVKGTQFLINGRPFYFKGFGKHEDSHIHGRGLDEAVNVKDLALMEWIGANSLRTSHYPYAEEMLRLCDAQGVVVIDELPAVGLHANFVATGLLDKNGRNNTWEQLKTARHHREVLEALVERDEHHACVVMWSIANEPAAEEEGAAEYFAPLCGLARKLDWQGRPVSIVTYEGCTPDTCKAAPLVDVLCINRYFGWYNYCGRMDIGAAVLEDELRRWHEKYPDKPLMMCEYGADTVAGVHSLPSVMFSEEFQSEFLDAYHKVFDTLPFFIGEHVWNFADFATAQNAMRVQGNKKGIFTRERQPKAAAFLLQRRWKAIPDFGYKG